MIRWSATSVADLESRRDYISDDSEVEAIRFLKEIKVRVMEITEFPFISRVVPEMND